MFVKKYCYYYIEFHILYICVHGYKHVYKHATVIYSKYIIELILSYLISILKKLKISRIQKNKINKP